jgi:predicted ATPase
MPGGKRPRQTGLNLGPEGKPAVPGGGFLRHVEIDAASDEIGFPFSIPAIRQTRRIELHPAVTFFIGENGTGKSTLLEALAVKCGFHTAGGAKRGRIENLGATSDLHQHLTIARADYPSDGWFLRAESFYNIATELEELDKEPFCEHGFVGYGGKSLHEQSHGEAFLALLQNRLQGHGLYLFDEPEAALSPQRQLAVLTLLHRLVKHHSQLIIATHSPILLAYPHARILEFTERGIREIAYTDTEHYRVTHDFLVRHERMMEFLLEDED